MARFDPRYGTNAGYAAGEALLGLSQLLRQGVGDYQRLDLDEEKRRQDERDYLLRLRTLMSAEADREARTEDRRALLTDNREARQATAQATYLKQLADLAKEQRHEGARADVFGLTGQPGPARTVPVERLPQDANDAEAPPAEMTVPGAPRSFLDALREVGKKRGFVPSFSESDLRVLGEGKDEAPMVLPQGGTAINRKGEVIARGEPRETRPVTVAPGGALVDPTTGEVKYQAPERTPKPERLSRDVMDALRATGVDPDTATPAQIAAARKQIQSEKVDVAAAQSGARAGATLQYDVYGRRLKAAEEAQENVGGAQTIVDQIEELGRKLPVPDATARATGWLGRELGALLQTNPDAAEFKAKTGFLAQLARTFGERGVLTNQDVDRVQQLLPNLHDLDEVKARKVAAIRDIFTSAITRAQQRLEAPVGSPGAPAQIAPTAPAPAAPSGARIRVRRKADGQTGTILESDFDPAKYERL